MITIVDYGMGNLGSIKNMLRRIGAAAVITGDLDRVARASKLILPGVGSFDAAMERLDGSGLRDVLEERVLMQRVPILGICLGMQLLTRSSQEGARPGLGWIAATTRLFPSALGLKVPHMGWNGVVPTRESALTAGLPQACRFYFVHAYYVQVDDPVDSILRSAHGVSFDAAFERDNIYGVQFHPEKSHRFGMRLLENFAAVPC